jgi:hypothetical protein
MFIDSDLYAAAWVPRRNRKMEDLGKIEAVADSSNRRGA